MIPSEVSLRTGLGRNLGRLSKASNENMDRMRDTLLDDFAAVMGDPGSVERGRALSLALRLRNKNRGASHTQIPKKEAISVTPSTSGETPRYVRRCLASLDFLAK